MLILSRRCSTPLNIYFTSVFLSVLVNFFFYKFLAVKQALKKKYPSASESVITLALETTNYDQTKAEAVLNMMKDDSPKKKSKGWFRVCFRAFVKHVNRWYTHTQDLSTGDVPAVGDISVWKRL